MVYTVLLPKIKIGNSGEKQGIKILPLFPLKIFVLVSLLPDMTAYSALLCLKVIDCDPMDCSPPGSSVHRILQIRILEWVAMPSSGGSSLQFFSATNQVSILSLALGWMNLGCFIRSIFTYKKAHPAYLQVPSLD